VQYLESEKTLGSTQPNLAVMLKSAAVDFALNIPFKQKDEKGDYQGEPWPVFYHKIQCIATNLKNAGFRPADKMVIFARNGGEMLLLELAVMAMGGIAVPIFANFKEDTAELLINHSDATWLAVEGEKQFHHKGTVPAIQHVIALTSMGEGHGNLIQFADLLKEEGVDKNVLNTALAPDTICLNMYTSGTMGIPKCVQLTHGNILSQQAALKNIWKLDASDRFLSYLPWHHSFGGIFELFSALCSGATYHLESNYGKDAAGIFENWRKVKPTVFFSVPKVYQSLFELSLQDKSAEDAFFNSGLKFIFTAAAALPEKLSNEFQKRNIPVIEGWGLTETSPCCTLTDPSLPRENGVVGKPIPGVSIRIADDEEIQVKGPNVMVGYYKNEEANAGAFTEDGWYRTGDVGAITPNGLKLISRKDRIFKLSNGEKVIPTDLEKAIELKCHYVQYAVVTGSGEEYPVALIFPNKRLLEKPDYQLSPEEGCFCPRSLNELGRCLTGCLAMANDSIGQKFAKVKSAAIILDELNLDNRTLTPSMKLAPKNVLERYKAHLKNLYGDQVPVEEEVYIIELDPQKTVNACIK
jgi:long-subunit acyl-CoA synthetase (AMP-forming)